jgi:hypothetical protein
MSPSEAMAAHGLTVRAEFVPFSHSRNAKDMSLNWKVTLVKDGRDILTTDYSAGIGHCPNYQQNARWTTAYDAAIRSECENGVTYPERYLGKRAVPILPKPEDVLYSLVTDSDVIDYSNFEGWADSLGCGTDSRKADLRVAFQDY